MELKFEPSFGYHILDKNDPLYVSGPSEFLWLEKHAFLICTDSFHSSVFAILYDKPFVVFDREDSEKDILADKETMKTSFGIDVRGFAYPYNSFNDTMIALLKKHGFVYSRTCFATADFGLPEEPLFLKPTCHHADEGVEEMIDKFFAEKTDEPRMFYLWGHSYEFDDNDNWDYIENICKKIGGRDGIWYATNIETIDYLNAFRALTISDNGIINDSDKKIWACADGKEIVIEPHSSYGF